MEKNNEVNKDNTVSFTRLDNSTIEEKVFDAPTGDVIVEKKQLSWWDKLKIPSLKWIPSSVDTLAAAEARMLKGVKTPYQQRMVNIGQDAKGRDIFINTLILGSGPPIVLVHGFSSGVGLWSCNLDELSKFYTVYAIDLLGFGRSSRVPFKGKTPEEGQKYFVDSIHAWAEKEKLEKFNLFGHSFGAYIAAHYALQNPERIEKLILCDPWGVPAKPKEDETQKPNLKWRVIRGLVGSISKNPVELVRLAGPYGPGLVSKFRPDLVAKFRHIYDDDSVTNYVYHCLAQHPSGEAAFVACSIPLSAWAKKPLIEDLPNLSDQIKTLFIYGEDTWMNKKSGYDVAKKLKGGAEYVEFPGGHHVYAESHEYVNNLVGLFGTSADKYKNYVKYFNRYIAVEEGGY